MICLLEFHASRGIHNRIRHLKGLLRVSLHSLFRHLQKRFLDAGSVKCRRLVKEHVIVLAGPLLALGGGHLALAFVVKLVPDANEGERLRVLRSRILIEAVPPEGERIERLLVRDVVDQGAAVGTAVERVTKRLELLLPSRVPNLELDNFLV